MHQPTACGFRGMATTHWLETDTGQQTRLFQFDVAHRPPSRLAGIFAGGVGTAGSGEAAEAAARRRGPRPGSSIWPRAACARLLPRNGVP